MLKGEIFSECLAGSKDVYDLLKLLIINGRDLFVYCPGQQGNIQINTGYLYRYCLAFIISN